MAATAAPRRARHAACHGGEVTRRRARRTGRRWREKDADEQHYERDTRGQRSTAGHRANQGRRDAPDFRVLRGGACQHGCVERISARIAAIQESATLAVDAKAKALKAAGRERHRLRRRASPTSRRPRTSSRRRSAACRDPRFHHYSPTPGLPELREAIAFKTKRDSGVDCAAAQVIVTNGGKHAVYNTFQVLCNEGDEVLLPAPYWTSYPEIITLAGGVPVVLPDVGGRRLPRHRRAARSRVHAAHQGAAVRLAEQPDRRGLPARGGRGDRSLGARARHLGRHRRDLRAPHLRRSRVLVDARPRARAHGPLRDPERRREDLRDDGLARRLDDRAAPTSPRRPRTCSRTRRRTSRTSRRRPRSRR